MPLMTICTTASVEPGTWPALLKECSAKVASLCGKPEAYVMTLAQPALAMTMAGTDEPSCFVEIRSVGRWSGQQTRTTSQALCELLSKRLGVARERIYLNFTDVEGSHWGFDGSTFG